MKISHAGKWRVLGFTNEQVSIMFERLRGRAKSIIAKKHRKEYLKIFKELREKEINRLKREFKINENR